MKSKTDLDILPDRNLFNVIGFPGHFVVGYVSKLYLCLVTVTETRKLIDISPEGLAKNLLLFPKFSLKTMVLEILKWFDNYSLIFGLSIFAYERNKYLKYWNTFRGSILFLSTLYYLVNFVFLLFTEAAFVRNAEVTIYHISQLTYIGIIHVYRVPLSVLLKEVSNHLKPKQIIFMKKLVTVFTVMIACIYIKSRIIMALTFGIKNIVRNWSNFFFLSSILFHPDHHFCSCILYVFALLSCYYSCLNILEVMEKEVTSADSLVNHTSKIKRLVSQVNIVAGLPLMLLMAIFIVLPGVISFSSRRSNSQTSSAWKISEIFIVCLYCITILSLVALVTRLKHKLEAKRNHVITKIRYQKQADSSISIKWRICLDELSNTKLFDFSILSMLSINIHLILSMVSSIITISILLIQSEASLNTKKIGRYFRQKKQTYIDKR